MPPPNAPRCGSKRQAWLSAKTCKRYRLPTEAEWEHACRLGETDPVIEAYVAADAF